MFTKLHVSEDECGGRIKFGAKNEEKTKAVDKRTWYFLRLTAKLSDNWMNKPY